MCGGEVLLVVDVYETAWGNWMAWHVCMMEAVKFSFQLFPWYWHVFSIALLMCYCNVYYCCVYYCYLLEIFCLVLYMDGLLG